MDLREIEETDIFEKHPEFCFCDIPMKAHKIRELRNEISKKLGIKITYTNCLIQGLKRGIGIYTKRLPDIYLKIVQELAQNKQLGLVISDESLALGINMPFKTVIIAGWKESKNLDSILYHQMIGRAGRRGHDTEGNVVYVNVDWNKLINSPMEKIIGQSKDSLNSSYSVIDLIMDKNYSNVIKNNFLSNDKFIISLWDKNIYTKYNYNTYNLRFIWLLREEGDCVLALLEYINFLEMNYKGSSISQKVLDNFFSHLIGILFFKKQSF